jgi:phosphoglycolate phosphatase-like HAD superfamily hydrolase
MTDVFGTYGALVGHKFGGKTDWLTLHELLPAAGIAHEEIERRMHDYNVAMGVHLDAIIGQYEVTACPGSLELVEALSKRNDIGLGLVTGNVSSTAPIKLRAAGFDPDIFPVGAYGHEAMERDNLPGFAMARASEHYRYPFTPQDVIVVGDTLADIACARALGAVAVAVATGFEKVEDLQAAKPDYFLRDLTEFGQVLE